VGGDFWNNKNLTKKFIGGKSLNKERKSDNFFPTFPCFLNLHRGEIKSSPSKIKKKGRENKSGKEQRKQDR
jgi:hypothetical protein